MKREKIKAEIRKVLGKKTKNLRKQGILPANLYGKKVKSQALAVNAHDFKKVYESAGYTTLVDLELEKKTQPVLIHHLQIHPVNGAFLHVDFHQVSLEEKINAEIPLVISGKSSVVEAKQGVLIQPLSKLAIEALPTELPEKIEVDISSLKEVNQEIKVKDLILPKGVALSSNVDANSLVVKIGPLEEEIAEVKPPAAEAEAVPAEEQKEGEVKKEDEAVKEKEKPAEKEAKEKPQEKSK